MPVIVAWILGGLVQVAGTLVGKVLLSLGIGYAVYNGVDTSLAWAKGQFVSQLGGIPAKALQMAALAKVGVCVSMLVSALSTRLLMQGMTSGALKRMVVK
jgi:Protein of unknown function (DUF2523)